VSSLVAGEAFCLVRHRLPRLGHLAKIDDWQQYLEIKRSLCQSRRIFGNQWQCLKLYGSRIQSKAVSGSQIQFFAVCLSLGRAWDKLGMYCFQSLLFAKYPSLAFARTLANMKIDKKERSSQFY
jgi:hypothetical protein